MENIYFDQISFKQDKYKTIKWMYIIYIWHPVLTLEPLLHAGDHLYVDGCVDAASRQPVQVLLSCHVGSW